METNKYFFLVFLTLLILNASCDKMEDNELILRLNTNELLVYCPDEDCRNFNSKDYPENAKNIIQIEIFNKTDSHYFITAHCGNFDDSGCYLPSSNGMMSISNFEFKNAQNETVPVKISGIHTYYEKLPTQDSIKIDFYKKMGYPITNNYGKTKSDLIRENTIFIPAGQKVYLESLIYFPVNIANGNQGIIELDKNEEYITSVIINSDSTNISKFFPREFIETAQSNNYLFYQGELKSNQVKLKFIEQ